MLAFLVLLSTVSLGVATHNDNIVGDASSREAFRAFYSPLVDKLKGAYGSTEFTYRFYYQLGGGRQQQSTITGKTSDGCYVLENATEVLEPGGMVDGKRSKKLVEGLNPRYSFELTRGTDDALALKSVTLRKQKRPPLVPALSPIADAALGVFYSSLVQESEFPFVSFSKREFRGTSAVELIIDVSYEIDTPPRVHWSRHCYFFHVDTGVCLGRRAFATRSSDGDHVEQRCEYDLSSQVPALKQIEQWRISGDKTKSPNLTLSTRIEHIAAIGPLPVSTFTLSAYGFFEPDGVSFPQPTPWFLYAGVGAGLIILLIILLGVWQRRLAQGAS